MDTGITYTGPSPADVLRYQLHRNVTNLFKSYLILLEDLGDSHDEALAKLKTALPENYRGFVDLADYLTPERGQILRKKILDAGNDSLRSIDELVKQFQIEFNK